MAATQAQINAILGGGDDDAAQEDAIGFSGQQIVDDINAAMKSKLAHERWNPKKVDQWTKDIIHASLAALAPSEQTVKKPFKYVVTCCIMQRTGAGMVSSFSAFWDPDKDGVHAIPYSNEYGDIHCVTTIFWSKYD